MLVVALLLAQHTALAHQLEHLVGSAEERSTLCDSHDLLGTVLGVATGSATGQDLLSLDEARTGAPLASEPQRRQLSPKSRGPPLIS